MITYCHYKSDVSRTSFN